MNNLSKNKGITLISLIITIIVMLILAGVSLNMVTGENSVLKMATSASYAQSAGALSEFFKLHALGTYNGQNHKPAKLDLLEKEGFVTRRINVVGNDVFYAYIVNRDSLPDNIVKGISDGYNAEDNLTDYYGVNSDYSVYYINSAGELIFGECKYLTIPDGEAINASEDIDKVLKKVFNTEIVTAGNLKGVTELRINENNDLPHIKNLDLLYYFPYIKSLYIYKTDLDNMDGLKYCKGVTYLYMDTNTVTDYSGLSELINLRDIYFYNLYTSARRITDNDMRNILAALSPLEKLVSFRVYAYQKNTYLTDAAMISEGLQNFKNKSNMIQLIIQNAKLTGEIDIRGFNSLQTLYLSDHLDGTSGITEVKGLGDCKNLTKLDLKYNRLKTLNGLEDIEKKLDECYLANNSEILEITTAQVNKIQNSTKYSIPFKFSSSFGITDINVSGSGLTDSNFIDLKDDESLTKLNIANNPNISFDVIKDVLPTLKGLQSLTISKNSQITDLQWMLDDSGNPVFPNLNYLEVQEMGNSFNDFEVLREYSTLRTLYIGNNKGLTNLDFLEGIPELTGLYMTYCWGLTDVSGLQHVPNLTGISLYGCAAQDISAIGNLTKITSLNIGRCDYVNWNNAANTDALNNMTSLTSVMMGGATENWENLDLRKIQPMIDRCVKGLDFMAYTSVDSVREKWVSDIKDLSEINQITLVYALYDQSERVIQKIDFSGCTNLKSLKISGPFAIKELVISGCTNLESLYCNKLNGGSYITLPDITNNTNLKSITWTYNLLNDTDIIKLAAQSATHELPIDLDFSNNSVTNIEPLTGMVGRINSLNLKGNSLYETTSNQQVKAALGAKLTLD